MDAPDIKADPKSGFFGQITHIHAFTVNVGIILS